MALLMYSRSPKCNLEHAKISSTPGIRDKTESQGGQRGSSLRERGLLLWGGDGTPLPSIGTPFALAAVACGSLGHRRWRTQARAGGARARRHAF